MNQKSDIPANSLTSEQIQYGIEEIQGMREEINWRVKVAYNSSIVFLSAIAFIIGTVFSSENKFLESLTINQDLRIQVCLVVVVLISSWVGVQNANHIIEKRIELYTLTILRVISSSDKGTYYGWIGYLYGSKFFKNTRLNIVAKFLNASIGLFIYFLPNAISCMVWAYLILFESIGSYKVYFIVVTIFLLIAIGTSLLLFFYVLKLNSKSRIFYKNHMLPFFNDHIKNTHK